MRRVRLWHILVYVAGMIVVVLLPVGDPNSPPTWLDYIGADKMFHAFLFFWLMLLLLRYERIGGRWWLAALLAATLGGTTEALQLLSWHHTASFWDWLADLSGICAAMWANARLLPRLLPALQDSPQDASLPAPATHPSQHQEKQNQ